MVQHGTKDRTGLEKIPSRDQYSDNVDEKYLLDRYPEVVYQGVTRLQNCAVKCFSARGIGDKKRKTKVHTRKTQSLWMQGLFLVVGFHWFFHDALVLLCLILHSVVGGGVLEGSFSVVLMAMMMMMLL